MKKDWTIKKLGDVCDIIGGGTPSKKNKDYYKGNIPWASVRDMSTDDISETEFYINDKAVKESSTNIIPKGNVIIATRVGLGKVCIINQDTAINQDLKGIVPNKNVLIDNKYLFYYFKSIANFIISNGVGATVQGVKISLIEELNFPLPPLEEQKRIVAVLDKKFAQIKTLKTAAEKNLQNTKQLFQAELEKAFSNTSWEKKRLEKIANIKSGFAFKSSAFKTEGEYQVLRLGNVKQNYLRVEEKAIFVSDISESDFLKAKVNIGDLVVTQTGTKGKRDYGFVAIVDRDNLLLNQRLAAITVSEEIYNRFLLYYSYTEDFKNQFFANEGGTVGQGNIGLTDIKEIEIPLPPLEGQKRIVAHLDSLSEKVHQLEEIYTKQLADCDELKQSLLQKAFEGEL